MRKGVSPEASRRHLYPPLFIWTLEILTYPWAFWTHVALTSEGRASSEE